LCRVRTMPGSSSNAAILRIVVAGDAFRIETLIRPRDHDGPKPFETSLSFDARFGIPLAPDVNRQMPPGILSQDKLAADPYSSEWLGGRLHDQWLRQTVSQR
jgi:hypothetical protein